MKASTIFRWSLSRVLGGVRFTSPDCYISTTSKSRSSNGSWQGSTTKCTISWIRKAIWSIVNRVWRPNSGTTIAGSESKAASQCLRSWFRDSKTGTIICRLKRFMGHGSGEKYINHNHLDRLQNLDIGVMLMGCGSARLLKEGHFWLRKKSLWGIVGDYLSSDV